MSERTPTDPTESMTFLALAPCGCVKMAVVDSADHRPLTAREVSLMIRRGYRVERVTTAEVRTMPWRCEEHRQPVTEAVLVVASAQRELGL
jgi:hypothetical protein